MNPSEPELLKLQKQQLRRSLLQQRRDLPTSTWQQQSQQICQQIETFKPFQTARTVLTYFSIRQEPDLSSLVQKYPEKCWAFPRCVGQTLVWQRWQWGEPLGTGSYNIPEPLPSATAIAPETADLMLVPAVGCDPQGNRLGYGGGFYDRCLANPALSQLTTLGIVFDFALLKTLPADPWDRPLSNVCTHQGILHPPFST